MHAIFSAHEPFCLTHRWCFGSVTEILGSKKSFVSNPGSMLSVPHENGWKSFRILDPAVQDPARISSIFQKFWWCREQKWEAWWPPFWIFVSSFPPHIFYSLKRWFQISYLFRNSGKTGVEGVWKPILAVFVILCENMRWKRFSYRDLTSAQS